MDETSGNIMTAVTGVTETNLVHGERSQRPNSPQEYSLPVEEVKQPRDVTLCSAVSCIQCFFLSAICLKCCTLLATSLVRSSACKTCQGTCLDIFSSPSRSAAVVWDRAANVHTTICSRGSCRQAHQSTEGKCCSQVCTAEVWNGRRRTKSEIYHRHQPLASAQSFIHAEKKCTKHSDAFA